VKQNRLSCLTPLAFFSILLSLIAIFATRALTGGAMFSPGPLNSQSGDLLGGVTSHAQAGKDCAACHPAPWSGQTMADTCSLCHTSVAEDILKPETLHGALFAQNPSLACRNCHPEHRGPDAALTLIETAGFPHQADGFSLTAHARRTDGSDFVCADCHPDGLTTFRQPICAECHGQIDSPFVESHTLSFGSDCLACHDGLDRFSQFDHTQTPFQLTGAHLQAACDGCHLNPRSVVDFKNTPSACEDCHLEDDAHAGEFGRACGACHTPDAWTPATFDHNLAAFKLEGKHSEVTCDQCHINGYAGTPADCFSCHQQDDAHSGEFGTQCETCHNPTGWENATFDHNLASFPLDGAHIAVACGDCHKNNTFKGTPTACSGCHADPDFHAGMFTGQACSVCHTTAAWRPASYNGPHSFPMDHGEQTNACADCHQPNLTVWTCYSCHDQGEIAQKHQEEGISDFNDCLGCHPTGREEEGGDGGGDGGGDD
jgi:hypothetical protein